MAATRGTSTRDFTITRHFAPRQRDAFAGTRVNRTDRPGWIEVVRIVAYLSDKGAWEIEFVDDKGHVAHDGGRKCNVAVIQAIAGNKSGVTDWRIIAER